MKVKKDSWVQSVDLLWFLELCCIDYATTWKGHKARGTEHVCPRHRQHPRPALWRQCELVFRSVRRSAPRWHARPAVHTPYEPSLCWYSLIQTWFYQTRRRRRVWWLFENRSKDGTERHTAASLRWRVSHIKATASSRSDLLITLKPLTLHEDGSLTTCSLLYKPINKMKSLVFLSSAVPLANLLTDTDTQANVARINTIISCVTFHCCCLLIYLNYLWCWMASYNEHTASVVMVYAFDYYWC